MEKINDKLQKGDVAILRNGQELKFDGYKFTGEGELIIPDKYDNFLLAETKAKYADIMKIKRGMKTIYTRKATGGKNEL